MRISVDTLLEIQKIADCQVEVGGEDQYSISLRFGYWKKLSDSNLTKIKEILKYRDIQSYWIEKKGPKSKMKNQF